MYKTTTILLLILHAFSTTVESAGVTIDDMKDNLKQLRDNAEKDISTNLIAIRQIRQRIALYEGTVTSPGITKIDQAAAPYLTTLNQTKSKAVDEKKDISPCLKDHEEVLVQLPGNLKTLLKTNVSTSVQDGIVLVLGFERQLNDTIKLVEKLEEHLSLCKGDADQECILNVGDGLKNASFIISNTAMVSLSNSSKTEMTTLTTIVSTSSTLQGQMKTQGAVHIKHITDCSCKILSGCFDLLNSIIYDLYANLLG